MSASTNSSTRFDLLASRISSMLAAKDSRSSFDRLTAANCAAPISTIRLASIRRPDTPPEGDRRSSMRTTAASDVQACGGLMNVPRPQDAHRFADSQSAHPVLQGQLPLRGKDRLDWELSIDDRLKKHVREFFGKCHGPPLIHLTSDVRCLMSDV